MFKEENMRRFVVLLGCLSCTVLLTRCSLLPQVKLEVTGSAPTASIIYEAGVDYKVLENVSLPWSYSFVG